MLEMYFDSVSCCKINETKRNVWSWMEQELSGRNWGCSNGSAGTIGVLQVWPHSTSFQSYFTSPPHSPKLLRNIWTPTTRFSGKALPRIFILWLFDFPNVEHAKPREVYQFLYFRKINAIFEWPDWRQANKAWFRGILLKRINRLLRIMPWLRTSYPILI